jgi:rRNA maturation protein Nop10
MYIESDARFCPACQSHSPFGFLCPACLHPIEKVHQICSNCGRKLYIACPSCGKQTFAQEKCEQCGAVLTVLCKNPRCGMPQFFENIKCTACGKKIKASKK